MLDNSAALDNRLGRDLVCSKINRLMSSTYCYFVFLCYHMCFGKVDRELFCVDPSHSNLVFITTCDIFIANLFQVIVQMLQGEKFGQSYQSGKFGKCW